MTNLKSTPMTSSDLQCHHCDKIVEPILEPAGKHIKASCPLCKRYIKFVSQTPLEDACIWFGKYRGTRLVEILENDREYLEWLARQVGIGNTLKENINKLLKN